MRFHIITLFPEMFDGVFAHSIIKRAQEKSLVKINFIQLRDFAVDKHGTVDEKPYGGGVGMLLRPEPIFAAVRSISQENTKTEVGEMKSEKRKIILLTPRGQKLTQEKVREFAGLNELILICGRYEGVDERVHTSLADEEVSIGDYVLSGGEIAAMIVVDAVTRLIEGVIKKEEATRLESFSENITKQNLIEYPQYTRPEDFEGLKVPEILLSGDHKKIEEWRKEQAKKLTREKRPDLVV